MPDKPLLLPVAALMEQLGMTGEGLPAGGERVFLGVQADARVVIRLTHAAWCASCPGPLGTHDLRGLSGVLCLACFVFGVVPLLLVLLAGILRLVPHRGVV
jgi:hypothetical protein